MADPGSILFATRVLRAATASRASASFRTGYDPRYSRTCFFVSGLVYRKAHILVPSF